MNKMLERHKIILKTGEWWAIRWWQEDQYYKDGRFTKAQVEAKFNELIKVFDADWLLAQKTNNKHHFLHPLANYLVAEGLYFFQFLYSLGVDLNRVIEAGLLRKSLLSRLKNPNAYWESAVFELQLLSYFLYHGFYVDPNYISGKGKKGKCNCDFKISKRDETIFLEAKRPREMHRNNKEICRKSSNRFKAYTLERSCETKAPEGTPLSPKPELKKIFKNLIYYAVKRQLPSNGAGGVIIESSWPLHYWEVFKEMANRRFHNKGVYSHLSFIVAVNSSFGVSELFNHEIRILLNPHTNIDVSSYKALSAIRSFNMERKR